MVQEQRQVTVTFAQGRNDDRDHIDAIEEVLSEAALADHVFEIIIGCGNEPEIDLLDRSSAQSLGRVLLQHTQQFGLQVLVESADLVEE